MANVLIEESTMSAIGNAIREKTGKTDLILPTDMPTEIEGIESGGSECGSSKVMLIELQPIEFDWTNYADDTGGGYYEYHDAVMNIVSSQAGYNGINYDSFYEHSNNGGYVNIGIILPENAPELAVEEYKKFKKALPLVPATLIEERGLMCIIDNPGSSRQYQCLFTNGSYH